MLKSTLSYGKIAKKCDSYTNKAIYGQNRATYEKFIFLCNYNIDIAETTNIMRRDGSRVRTGIFRRSVEYVDCSGWEFGIRGIFL